MGVLDDIFDVQRKIAEIQEADVRSIAMRLLGEETGDPTELMRRLQEGVRKWAGPTAALIWCVVEEKALAPGVAHESYLAIDTGKPDSNPVRIGPVVKVHAWPPTTPPKASEK